VSVGSARLTAFAMFGTVLATVVLISVIQGGPWFWQCVGAALLVGLVGVAARRRGIPRPVTALGQLVVLVAYLTWLYVPEPAVAGVYPGPAAVRTLDRLVTTGFTEIRDSAAPVAATPGVMLITVAGVALMLLLVDLLAVAYRHTALAGLPLLALYTVPASVLPDGINGLLFLFPAAGYLAILLAEGRDRVQRWGLPLLSAGRETRLFGADRGDVTVSVSSTELNQLGRRIGIAALGLAIVVPAVLPGLSEGVFLGGGSGDGGRSGRTISTLNALVSLRRDLTRTEDVEVLRIRTDAPAPGDLYLRTVTLDLFDGQDWRASNRRVERFDRRLPAPAGLESAISTRTVHTTLRVTDQLQSDYLPVPYPATQVAIDGEWRVDTETQNIVSQRGRRQISGQEYTVDSLDLSPTRDQMLGTTAADPSVNRYLRLPRLPQSVTDQAVAITRGAASPLDRAMAIQNWLRDPDNFTYDLDVSSGTGTSAILEFLRDRRGYCEQFASTMAVMARIVGIPARVNVGFTSGDLQSDGSLLVTSHDAHAWPELYFPGVGWSRFEPTPATASSGPSAPLWLASTTQPTTAGSVASPTSGATTPSPTSSPGAALDCAGADRGRPQCREFSNPQTGPLPAAATTPWALLAMGVVALLLATPALLRAMIRHRRWARAGDPRRRAEAAWAELQEAAWDLRYGWADAETPRQAAARMVRAGKLRGRNTRALMRITSEVEYARYAPDTAGWPPRSEGDPRHDVRQVRGALAAATRRRVRLRAALLPPSSMRALGQLGGRIIEALDALEEGLSRLRGRLLSRASSAPR
jgi:transglutaminase-like putative cysteine protease